MLASVLPIGREQGHGTDTRAGGWWYRSGLFGGRHKGQAAQTTATHCGLKMELGPPIGDAVKQAADAIDAGELAKVVVAREVEAVGSIDPAVVLARLSSRFEVVCGVRIRPGDVVLCGRQPRGSGRELNGDVVTTYAVAGTAPRGATPTDDAAIAERLATDPKEQAEHHYVVEYLRTRLALAGVALDPTGDTEVRTLPGIHHLVTTVSGRIAPEPGMALRLVGALHPTPAVGGTPTNVRPAVDRRA